MSKNVYTCFGQTLKVKTSKDYKWTVSISMLFLNSHFHLISRITMMNITKYIAISLMFDVGVIFNFRLMVILRNQEIIVFVSDLAPQSCRYSLKMQNYLQEKENDSAITSNIRQIESIEKREQDKNAFNIYCGEMSMKSNKFVIVCV